MKELKYEYSLLLSIKSLCVIALLLSSHVLVFGQKNDKRFDHFTTMDGLSQGTVYAITQDRYGFMWFGTHVGLNKFDGYSFKVFKHDSEDSLSIAGNDIVALCEDSQGGLWVGTRGGGLSLFDYSTEKFKSYHYKTTDSTNYPVYTIYSFYEHDTGELLVGTNYGLTTLDREKDELVGTSNKILGLTSIRTISRSSIAGAVWLGTKHGLHLYDINKKEILRTFLHDEEDPNSLSSNYVTSLTYDTKGKLWVGTHSDGLNCLADINTGFIKYRYEYGSPNGVKSDDIRTLHQSKDGSIWVGTKKALEQLTVEQQSKENPNFIHHTKDDSNENSINQNSIYSFYEDVGGDYWIGTYSGGVNFLYNGSNKFRHYRYEVNSSGSLSHDVVSSFARSDYGVWIGTEGGGLNLWDREARTFKHFDMSSKNSKGLTGSYMKALKVDHNGDLWIGTFDGLFKYDIENAIFETFFEREEIVAIEEGLDNELWVGTGQNLKVFDTEKRTFKTYQYSVEDSTTISNNSIKKIIKRSNGGIWIGTRNGLNNYDRNNDRFIRYLSDENKHRSISNSNITTMCEGNDGSLWVGTFNGINHYLPEIDEFEWYDEKSGLPSSIVLNILFDNEGYLWLTSNKELVKCDPNASPKQKFVLRTYDSRDGLQNGEFRIDASMINEHGEIFLGGVKGFNVFDPSELSDNLREPVVALTDLKLFNKSVEIGGIGSPLTTHIGQAKSITLDYDQSFIEFSYVALNYVSSSKNQYAYKLEGLEEDWNYVQEKRSAKYNSLPAGEYTFRVIAANNDGIWNMQGHSLQVIVLAPWWETWLFKVFTFASLVLMIGGFFSVRINILTKQRRTLTKTVKERTFDLQSANAKLKTHQKAILSQNEELEIALDKLKNTQTQLVQSEKMASIGILTSGLAHEINNPLNFIQGSKNYIEEYTHEHLKNHENELMTWLDTIQLGLDRVEIIVSCLDRFNRRNIDYSDECLVHSIIDDCLVILQSRLRGRVEIHKDYCQEITMIGNEGELHQLILNVLSNAEQSITDLGEITIATSTGQDKYSIIVKDTGEGIDKNDLDKITDPFYTTKAPGNGIGLGMSIAFEIAKKHNGNIFYESELGKGTTVTMEFKK